METQHLPKMPPIPWSIDKGYPIQYHSNDNGYMEQDNKENAEGNIPET
jgi:hypothetical protein